MKSIPHIITDKSISLTVDGKTTIIARDNAMYQTLVEALKAKAWDLIPALADKAKAIEQYGQGRLTVKDEKIIFDDQEAPQAISDRISAFMREGLPFEPLIKFWENLKQNPDERARKDLYTFLEKQGHPITEDGYFLAYKRVADDYASLWSGNNAKTYVMNKPGTVVKMRRSEVNPDPNVTCSYGLHVANYNYADKSYMSGRGRLVIVKVHPKDVVAIPIDYNQEKMRVCEYFVVGDADTGERKEVLYKEEKKEEPTTALAEISKEPQLPIKKSDIVKAIKKSSNNYSVAAKVLEISRSSLFRLRKKFGLK